MGLKNNKYKYRVFLWAILIYKNISKCLKITSVGSLLKVINPQCLYIGYNKKEKFFSVFFDILRQEKFKINTFR